MFDFISCVKNVLEEQNKTTEDLLKDGVIPKNTFYKYRHRYPSLSSLLKIANYLCVNVDYLLDLSDTNNFKPYKLEQENLNQTIVALINNLGKSQREFSKELDISRANLQRWKKGTSPNVQTLIEISKYFNVPIDDLLEKSN